MKVKTEIGTFNMSMEGLNILSIVFADYANSKEKKIAQKMMDHVADQIYHELSISGYYDSVRATE